MNTKRYAAAVVIALLFIAIIVGNIQLISAQNGTEVSGIINHDTTWNQAGSPYYLTNDTTVAEGVTLTIERGVEVQFSQYTPKIVSYLGIQKQVDDYYTWQLQINGTLHAVGTPNSPISFEDYTSNTTPNSGYTSNRGIITFYNASSNSSIQNAKFADFEIIIYGTSPSFVEDTGLSLTVYDGSPLIENNFGTGFLIMGGSPTIINNRGSCGDLVYSSAIFRNNTGSIIRVQGGSPTIVNNTLSGGGYDWGIELANYQNQQETAVVTDNTITGTYNYGGILIRGGSPVVERNFVNAGGVGISIYGDSNPIIENNTVIMSNIGLNIYSDSTGSPSPTIAYNNFEQNSQYNIYLGQQNTYGTTAPNINASNNWWGTTDLPTINATIFDHKDNFNLGTVTFTPVLDSPNQVTSPIIDSGVTVPTTHPSQSSTAAPSQGSGSPTQTTIKKIEPISQEWLYGIIVVLAAAVVILSTALVTNRRKIGTLAQK
jgi:parallel beta-helix repeat protein